MHRRLFLGALAASGLASRLAPPALAREQPAAATAPAGAPTRFQYACMTLPYSAFPLERALTGIKAAGYDHVAWGVTHKDAGGQQRPAMDVAAPPAEAAALARRCRDLRIAAHDGGGDGAVDQDLQLHRQRLRVIDAELHQKSLKPNPPLFLERERDLVGRVGRLLELGDGVHEGAAPEHAGRDGAFETVEGAHDLFQRRPVGGRRGFQPARQVGHDQVVLRRKVVVERALADADLGGDRVDPDGANALAVEQPVGGLEDALLHRCPDVRSRHDALTPCRQAP